MQNREQLIERAVELLNAGEVISFPTETVYALACSADNEHAIEKIFNIKQRKKDMVLAMLVSDIKMLQDYAFINETAEQLIKEFSPGPTTYILKAKNDIKLFHTLIKNGKIGLRIPDHDLTLKILIKHGKPIAATSVNLSGNPSAIKVSDIDETMKSQIPLIIDGGECKFKEPSTVLEMDNDKFKIIRSGSNIDLIKKYLT